MVLLSLKKSLRGGTLQRTDEAIFNSQKKIASSR